MPPLDHTAILPIHNLFQAKRSKLEAIWMWRHGIFLSDEEFHGAMDKIDAAIQKFAAAKEAEGEDI